MNLQKNTMRRIRTEFDFESYADEHLQTHPNFAGVRGDEIRACCPKCGETRYRLYLNNNKKFFNCFNCGFSNKNSDVFDLVSAAEGITRFQAIIRLSREYTEVTPQDLEDYFAKKQDQRELFTEKKEEIKTIDGLPSGMLLLDEETPKNKKFWDYLYSRGLTKQEILDMRTYYSPKRYHFIYRNGKRAGNLGNRFLWPVYGGDNELVSWLARTVEPESTKQKYLNCPLSDMAKTVWPYSPPPKGTTEAILVEGVLDCLALRRAGFTAYATFGKKVSTPQINLLVKWGITDLTIMYDCEAKRDIKKAVEEVKMRFRKTSVVDQSDWDANSDPGDLLARADGCDILNKTLSQRIDVYSLDYVKWALE